MDKTKKASLLLILSMIIFGTIGPFVRSISLSSGEIALCRAVMATVLIGLYLLFTKQRISLKEIKKELPLLILSGAAMGTNWIFLFEAYKYTTVSAATLSYYFAPVIVLVACPFLFREKLNSKQILCFVMSTVGLVMITGLSEPAESTANMVGILFGLAAACFYATVILLNKFIRNVAGIHRTFLQFLSAIAVLFPYVLLSSGLHLDALSGPAWSSLLTVGILHTGITYCMYFSSLKELPGQQAAILSYIDPLVAVLVSFFILGEKMTALQLLGGVLILGFTLWNESAVNNEEKEQ